jgi:hypothetical protein
MDNGIFKVCTSKRKKEKMGEKINMHEGAIKL